MKTWTATQLRHFLEYVSADRLYSLWLTAASTGMRRSEVLGLRWEDFDPNACRVATRQVVVLVDHQPVIKATNKTDASTRLIALDAVTLEALREHRKQQLEERLAWGPAWIDSGLMFTCENGAPINPERLTRWFEARVRASGLPLIRLHDLRHTHATLALQAGVHAKVVQERLGHSSISMTLDTYSHAIPAMQEDAAERVANLVFGR
jgi:integrase